MEPEGAAPCLGRSGPSPSEEERVLVVNCGSSSIKYQLLAMSTERRPPARGPPPPAPRVPRAGPPPPPPPPPAAPPCRALRELPPLAPVHNPANLVGIEICLAA